MSEIWVIVSLAASLLVAVGLVIFAFRSTGARRPITEPDAPEPDGRDTQLARRLAQVVGCTVAQALPAVRREIDYAPHQSDEVLLKRAAYHYRQDLPERACPVYPERSRG